jgi:hypothetical protein
MEVIVFQKQYPNNDAVQSFINSVYQKGMTRLASDLLANNVQPDDIKLAVKKAILSIEKAGIDSKKHFQPVISVKKGQSFLDCRLSKLGYSMVLLNAEPKSEYIANFQVNLANQVINLKNKP